MPPSISVLSPTFDEQAPVRRAVDAAREACEALAGVTLRRRRGRELR